MKPQIIFPVGAPKAVGPYNHAVRVGDLLFSSGQIPLDAATGQLVGSDVRAQTKQVLANIGAILASEGLSFANVIKTTVFMTNLADFSTMNEIYAESFKSDYPARSTVQVAALPRGAQVEIEFVAHYSTP